MTHKNADPDAVASAYIVSRIIEEEAISTHIVLPEGMNEVAKKIAASLGIHHVFHGPEAVARASGAYDTVYIVVDTSSPVQLGELAPKITSSRYILIDHHRPGGLAAHAALSIAYPMIRSTSEIAYILARCKNNVLSRRDALLVLTGILYDTRRLMYIDDTVFAIVSEIIAVHGVDIYREAIELLTMEMDLSERIARLKAAQRMRITRIKDYIIATTHVSAFEASAARAILDLGADAVFVASKGTVSRIVARAKTRFVRETGISLGRDVMPAIANCLGGSGGGHDTAAAAEGRNDPYRCLNVGLRVLRELLGK